MNTFFKIQVLFLLVVLGMAGGCRRGRVDPAAFITPMQPTFTAYNLYYEKPETVWAMNYQVGSMLPVGTSVLRYQTGVGSRRLSTLTIETGGENPGRFTIYLQPNFHPGMTIEDIAAQFFTTRSFDELTAGLNAGEIEQIRQGRIASGMSKRAVLVSVGPPAPHRTPSLDLNEWRYWSNRFHSIAYLFDEAGRVTGMPN